MTDNIWHLSSEEPREGDCIVSLDGIVGEYDGLRNILCPGGVVQRIRNWNLYAHIDDLISLADRAEKYKEALQEVSKELLDYYDRDEESNGYGRGVDSISNICEHRKQLKAKITEILGDNDGK